MESEEFNLRQNKIADYQMCVLSVLSLPLQSEHCKVVALFRVAHEVGYNLRHPFDERAGGGGDNRCFMSGLTVSQVPCVEIEHASEDGDGHTVDMGLCNALLAGNHVSDHTLCDGVGLLPDGLEEIVTQDS